LRRAHDVVGMRSARWKSASELTRRVIRAAAARSQISAHRYGYGNDPGNRGVTSSAIIL
jgi:hypothetical protein